LAIYFRFIAPTRITTYYLLIYKIGQGNKLFAPLQSSGVHSRGILLADASQELLDLSNGLSGIQTLKNIL
jgi:hypothetical protein